MKIFMTGATGFVGRSLSLQLQRDGHVLRVLTRSPEKAQATLGRDVQVVSMNDFSTTGPNALEGCEAVINLAGEPVVGRRWSAAQKARLWDSRVGITQTLVGNIARLASPSPVLISASAVGYYGNRIDSEIDETANAGSDFLADLCVAWEEAALQAQALGTRVVTLRTGIVLGQGGGALAKLAPLFRMAVGGRIGDGKQFVPWIHISDLVNAIEAALHNESITGPVNTVGPTPLTNRTFTKALAEAVHRPAVLPVPAPLLRLAMGESAMTLLGGQRAVPAKLLANKFEFQFPTLDAALYDLLEDTMGCTISKAKNIPDSSYMEVRRPIYELRQETVVHAPIDQVSAFFSQAENLGLLTPPNVDFSITSETPIEMSKGAEISYTIKIGKLPISWKTRIEAWEPEKRFVDAQMKGPYRCWWHQHTFRAAGNRTIMEDRVLYALPLGILGRIAHRLKVSRMLLEIFTYRTRAIQLRFGSPNSQRQASFSNAPSNKRTFNGTSRKTA
tara:strand:+ start:95022 stop:96530 length:1509 start_codon:yes stop_codon:yes gene_type:complete